MFADAVAAGRAAAVCNTRAMATSKAVLAAIGVLVGALLVGFTINAGWRKGGPPEVIVPNLISLKREDADEVLRVAGWKGSLHRGPDVSVSPENHELIQFQHPEPGQRIRVDSRIIVQFGVAGSRHTAPSLPNESSPRVFRQQLQQNPKAHGDPEYLRSFVRHTD